MKHPFLRWFFSTPATLFYCLAATALYKSLAAPSRAANLAGLLVAMFFLSGMARWVLADARQRGRNLPYDFGAFVFFAWPLVVPLYLFSTRGWRAFAPIGYFLLLYLAAALFAGIPLILGRH